ncbi:MAG: hypothetical protein ACK5WV_11070 [Chryseotalea sp.]
MPHLRLYHAFLTVPYAGNAVPLRFGSFFKNRPVDYNKVVDVANAISDSLGIACFAHTTARALVDVQSALGSGTLFSTISLQFSDEDKQHILERYYFPYRIRISKFLQNHIKPIVWVDVRLSEETTNVWQWYGIVPNEITQNVMAQLNPIIQLTDSESDKDFEFQHALANLYTDQEIAYVTLFVSKNFFTNNEAENRAEICRQLSSLSV